MNETDRLLFAQLQEDMENLRTDVGVLKGMLTELSCKIEPEKVQPRDWATCKYLGGVSAIYLFLLLAFPAVFLFRCKAEELINAYYEGPFVGVLAVSSILGFLIFISLPPATAKPTEDERSPSTNHGQ